MNDQDKKILELYLKDVRKKKIIFLKFVKRKQKDSRVCLRQIRSKLKGRML